MGAFLGGIILCVVAVTRGTTITNHEFSCSPVGSRIEPMIRSRRVGYLPHLPFLTGGLVPAAVNLGNRSNTGHRWQLDPLYILLVGLRGEGSFDARSRGGINHHKPEENPSD
ncbi:hypothetical protein V8F20_002959 [Naviculisporaceae sp. PSN 640]